jgi:tRNA pseudouridine55 synthase
MQVPSSVSAIKVDGERAYAKVRSGEDVTLAARPVAISKFEIISSPRLVSEDGKYFLDLDVQVDCSSGTYIRALARDLGKALNVGGHLTALRRTRIGKYSIDQAQQLEELTPESLDVLDISQAAKQQFALRNLSDQEAVDLRHGKRLKANDEGAEPFAGIDPIAVLEIQRIIGFLKAKGIGVLITDHNVRETLGICDHASIISEGRVLAEGKPQDIIHNPEVRRVYLGENFRM